MKFEEFKKQYYPSKEQTERIALNEFIWDTLDCDPSSNTRTSICNALFRADICSLEDLRDADIEYIKKIRGLGSRRIALVEELQNILKDLD